MKIKELREEINIYQKDLAEYVGHTTSFKANLSEKKPLKLIKYTLKYTLKKVKKEIIFFK